jgi:hypothetical protein
MPDGNAFRPGDILTGMTGKSTEILSTDAEGRLILADAMAYVKRYNPGGGRSGHAHGRHRHRAGTSRPPGLFATTMQSCRTELLAAADRERRTSVAHAHVG